MILPMECVSPLRWVLGIRSFVARSPGTRCPARAISTGHIRRCPRTDGVGAVRNIVKRRLVYCLRDMGVSLTVEDASSITNGIMDIVVPVGPLADATRPEFRDKGLLINLTVSDPHSTGHLHHNQPSGSAHINGFAASQAEATKRTTYAHHKRLAFDARSFILILLAVEASGRTGEAGQRLLDQVATIVPSRQGGGPFSRKGVMLERLRQTLSVAVQVALSR